jgi:hypothetical protein
MKALLLDSHISHTSDDFVITAAENNILIFTFPSHLTHILQPLDVGIFQPYKHWHREAVLTAIRDLDLEYSLRSFMRDLSQIREQTFKESTIIHAFQKAGIWPVSYSIALIKLRTYSQPSLTPTTPTTPTTLQQPSTPKPSSFKESEEGLQQWKAKIPVLFSSPSKESYNNWLTGTEEVLASGQLQELDLLILRRQVEEQKKRASSSRARLQVGGELTAAHAHELRAQKAELQAQKAQAKEVRVARQASNQAQKQLRIAGVEARKQERLRKKRVVALRKAGHPIPRKDQEPIPDPEAQESESESGSRSESRSRSRSWSGSEGESGNDDVRIQDDN